MGTYPIMLFPVFSILEKKMTIATSGVKSKVLRLFVVLLTGIIVARVPNFGQLMALVGASCCTLLAFIMPALMHLVLFRHDTDQDGPTAGSWTMCSCVSGSLEPSLVLTTRLSTEQLWIRNLIQTNKSIIFLQQPSLFLYFYDTDYETTMPLSIVKHLK